MGGAVAGMGAGSPAPATQSSGADEIGTGVGVAAGCGDWHGGRRSPGSGDRRDSRSAYRQRCRYQHSQ